MTEAEKIIEEKIRELRTVVAIGEEDIIDSLSSWIDKLKEDHIANSKVIYEANVELERKVEQQKEEIASLQKRLDRVVEQHDKAVEENKRLHAAVDNHGGVVAHLQKQTDQMVEAYNKARVENEKLRKRNGKLAKKLEMNRI